MKVRAGRQQRLKYANMEPLQGELGQKESLKRLASYLLERKVPLVAGVVFTLLWSVMSLGVAWLVATFTTAIEDGAKSGDTSKLAYLTGLGIVYFAGRAVVAFGKDFCWQYVAHTLYQRLRNEVFGHLQRLPISFFDQRKTGQLMSTLNNDIPAVNTVLSAIQDSINSPVILVGGVIALFVINWKLALISCLCLPPIAWIISKATTRMRGYARSLQSSLANLSDHTEEKLSGIRLVKAFGNEDYEANHYNKLSREVFRSALRTIRLRHSMGPAIEYLGTTAVMAVLLVGGYLHIQEPTQFSLEKGLLPFVMLLQQVAGAARNFGNISINLSAAGVAADRIFTLLNVKCDIKDKPEALELKSVRGRVEFDQVSFAYSPGIPVLDGISFTVEPGEVVALVGPTGSGKTTIASLIPRFYDVTNGSIRVDGYDVRDVTLDSLRGCIGMVPQDTTLFSGPIRDNIAYGRRDATEEEIIAAAKMANAWEFIERLPEGLDTVVGERGTRLSGGQRQRVAIARAVLRNPAILILDEATSSLDTQSEALVQDALQRLVRNRTTLVIAHRLSTIRKADKILVIKDGRIIEAGTHASLLSHGGAYADLYNTQFRYEDDASGRGPFE